MKTLQAVIIFAILGVSLSGKITEDMLTDRERECIKEVGTDVQTVIESFNDDYTITPKDPKINDYCVCWYRKSNAIDENDEIKFDVMKTIFSSYLESVNSKITDKDQAANDAVEACKNEGGDNLGDRLVKFGNCAVKQIKSN